MILAKRRQAAGMGSWFTDQGGFTKAISEFFDPSIATSDFLADWFYGKDATQSANKVLSPMPMTTKTPNTAGGLVSMNPDGTAVTASDLQAWRDSQQAAILADEAARKRAAQNDTQETWIYIGLAVALGVGVVAVVSNGRRG